MQIVTLKFRGFPMLRFGRVYFEPEKKRPPISLVGWPPMEEKNASLGWPPTASEGWYSAMQC